MERGSTRRGRAWMLLVVVLLVGFGGFPPSHALDSATASPESHGAHTRADEGARDRGQADAVVPALPSPLRAYEPGKVWPARIAPSRDFRPKLIRMDVRPGVAAPPAAQWRPPALGRSPPGRKSSP